MTDDCKKETPQEKREAENSAENPADRRELELYIHIPFCIRKCAYCDFLSFPADDKVKKEYTEHLISEVLSYREIAGKYLVSSIFIGGGTPSCLEAEAISRILQAVFRTFERRPDVEITIECNPGTLTAEKLARYKEAGINRLSIGLQSTDNKELKLLGRIHTWEQFLSSYELARHAGFDNINIDLMASLPGQTKEKFERTLRRVIALKPEHISAYSLIVEPGTPFYDRYREDVFRREAGDPTEFLPDEEEEYAVGKMTREVLEACGFHRYEISNYARPGKECRHNTGYWTGTEYLGLGLGASGYFAGRRCRNQADLRKYMTAVEQISAEAPDYRLLRESEEVLTEEDCMEEFMFLGLRMTAGISGAEFQRRFYRDIYEVYGRQLKRFLGEKLMGTAEDGADVRYFLTERGLDISNYCMAEFLFDDTGQKNE